MGGAALDRRTRQALIERLNRDGAKIAAAFGLRPRSIEAERANVKSRYGICYDDGTIKIRLHHAVTGDPLRYSSLVNTLCHELAHLRHFHHGPEFRVFYARLLEYARAQGLYRPRATPSSDDRRRPTPKTPAPAPAVAPRPRPRAPQAPPGPTQLTLF